MRKKLIKYRAIKVKSRPIKVEFFSKENKKLLFNAKGTYEVTDPSELRTPDLIRWLKKNGFPNLAKALKKITP